MNGQVIIGDCLDALRDLATAGVKVQCCVTSPPYWGLRDYGVDGQLGLERTPEEYVTKIVEVFRAVREILAEDGTLFLNLGDSYFGGGRGGGGSYDSERPGWHAIPYGTSGTAPEGSPSRDCLCENLCGACRVAYQTGKARSDRQPGPTPTASPYESTPEHTESPSARPPTSGSSLPVIRNAAATLDPLRSEAREGVLPRASRLSMHHESSPQRPGECLPKAKRDVCPLCGCSSAHCVPASDDRTACICDTATRLGACSLRTSGISSLDLAYPHCTTASLKPKDLVGIPWRVAFALQADGWYLRSDIIWHKPNPMPESVTDRPTKAHEYLFLLSKSKQYFYDAEAIKEPVTLSSLVRLSQNIEAQAGSSRVPGKTNGPMKAVGRKNLSETQAKLGKYGDKQRGYRRRHAGFNERWDSMSKKEQCSLMRNKRTVWTVPTKPYSEAHFATFPPDLIKPCILAGSRTGDTVLDPFGGSGTTGEVAEGLGREWILIELNEAYRPLIEKRTAQMGLGL